MPDPTDDLFGMPPLDLGETLGPQAPPPSAPSARARAKEYAPLLALLPLIARSGGRVGVAALLNGFQQARAQSQQTERQAQMDAERQRQTAEQERYRRDTLAQTTANNEATRRQQTLVAFQNGLKDLDSTEAADAYVRFWEPQLRAAGIRPSALNSLMSAQFGTTPQAQGLVERGNVDLYAQPVVPNPDGTSSTVDSFSVNIDGREVLLPTVTPDGRHLSQEDAIAEYEKTGRHLGVFDSPQSATAYASQLHRDYESGRYRTRPVNRFQKKEAESIIEQAKKQYGDQAVNNTYTLRDGTQANWEELNRRAGVTVGQPVVKTDAANTPEEQYVAESIAAAEEKAGRPLSRGEKANIRLRAKREWTAASDRTPGGAGMPDQMWVIRNGKPTPIPKGSARPGDLPYDAVAARNQPSDEPSPYSTERATRILSRIDDISNQVGLMTAGLGGYLAGLPATDARKLKGDIDELKANIAFNELTQMREASKTGGALGQIAVRELELLERTLGALDQLLSPADLKANLERVKQTVMRWNAAKAQQQLAGGGAPAVDAGWTDAGGGFKVRQKQ